MGFYANYFELIFENGFAEQGFRSFLLHPRSFSLIWKPQQVSL